MLNDRLGRLLLTPELAKKLKPKLRFSRNRLVHVSYRGGEDCGSGDIIKRFKELN